MKAEDDAVRPRRWRFDEVPAVNARSNRVSLKHGGLVIFDPGLVGDW
jgi:hypothetical protein